MENIENIENMENIEITKKIRDAVNNKKTVAFVFWNGLVRIMADISPDGLIVGKDGNSIEIYYNHSIFNIFDLSGFVKEDGEEFVYIMEKDGNTIELMF